MTAVILVGLISIDFNRDRSNIKPPSRIWFCAQLWPPEHMPMCIPSCAAWRTAAMTSYTSLACTTMSGRLPGSRTVKLVPNTACSNPASPRRKTWPWVVILFIVDLSVTQRHEGQIFCTKQARYPPDGSFLVRNEPTNLHLGLPLKG